MHSATSLRPFSRTGTSHLFRSLRFMLLAGCLVQGLPAPTWAGADGPGLPTTPTISDAELRNFVTNGSGRPVADLVCVDDPNTSCFTLEGNGSSATNPIQSPDCPAGPANLACRPNEIAGTAMTVRAIIDPLPPEQWTYTDVSSQYPPAPCPGGFHGMSILSPAHYDTVSNPQIGDHVYAEEGDDYLGFHDLQYQCAQWVRTDSSDASVVAPSQTTIQLTEHVYVYVAYDADATVFPDWLENDFTPIGDIIEVNTVGSPNEFEVHVYTGGLVSPGTFSFGGNANDGASGNLQHLIFVRKPDATETCGSYDATFLIQPPGGGSFETFQAVTESGCGTYGLDGLYNLDPPIASTLR